MRARIFIFTLTLGVVVAFHASAVGEVPPESDTTPPTVGLVSPTSATINTPTTFSAPYSDAVGVTSCNLFLENTNQGIMTLSGITSGTATKVHTFLLAGLYHFSVRCFDAAGNAGIGTAVTVTAGATASNTPAPALDTSAPSAPGSVVRTTPEGDNTPTFNWFDSQDNVGVSVYEVSLDGGPYIEVGNITTFTSAAVALGNHTFGVRARDAAGNVSDTVTRNFAITSGSPGGASGSGPPFTLETMVADAQAIVQGTTSTAGCQMATSEATNRVSQVFGVISNTTVRAALISFTSCGTTATRHLGAGERLGAVNSYKSAFGRLPSTQDQWYDVIKISNGRFPGETSASGETAAKTRFRTIYRRAPNMVQQNDKAAVNIMAYGLRPLPRNVNSERAAILTYKSIFGRGPSSATDWDAVRAIAYSGAKR